MFNFIATRMQNSLSKKLKKQTLSAELMKDALKDIRRSLLEADVNFKVVKEFINNVKAELEGYYIGKKGDAYKTTIGIFQKELTKILGSESSEFNWEKPLYKVMMVGLQGSGKTTTSAKIAYYAKKKHGKNPMLVANDIYRPAAIEQLRTLADSIKVDFYEEGKNNPVEVARNAIKKAKENKNDFIIFDTAGRLQINELLMLELKKMKQEINPDEIILVLDAMTGQDIINVANVFNNDLNLSGLIMTKLDSDARGGAALSVRFLTNVPIKMVGTGEKLTQLDQFYPDRMAQRILGLGDFSTLIEQAEEKLDEKKAKKSMTRMLSGQFDLEDFKQQLSMISSMGSVGGLMKMLPSNMSGSISENKMERTQKDLKIWNYLMDSMTKKERRNPKLLNNFNRRQRILKGSGRKPHELTALIKRFAKMKDQMKKMSQELKKGNFGNMGNMFG